MLITRRAWQRGWSAAAPEAIEVVLLLALFAVIAPVTAIGVYFITWHAWRHVLRVGAIVAPVSSDSQRRAAVWLALDYHRHALPLTLVSLGGMFGLTMLVGWRDLEGLIGTYLVLLSALTLPHALVIALWEQRAHDLTIALKRVA
jgi:beta-carotene 15,15'-dioxygenase